MGYSVLPGNIAQNNGCQRGYLPCAAEHIVSNALDYVVIAEKEMLISFDYSRTFVLS
jgi:hypothetical protein